MNDFIDELRLRTFYDYGIDIESNFMSHLLSLLDNDMLGAHKSEFARCVDIIWTDKQSFERIKNKYVARLKESIKNANN